MSYDERVTTPTILYFSGLNRTFILQFAVRAWLALSEQGHCSNTIQIAADQDAFGAFLSDKPVGVMTYRHVPALKELAIGIGYVLPEYRGWGIYTRLWDALVEKARSLDCVHISSATFVDNSAMRSVAAKHGRVESQLILDFSLIRRTG